MNNLQGVPKIIIGKIIPRKAVIKKIVVTGKIIIGKRSIWLGLKRSPR
jgi:hypothetical protein